MALASSEHRSDTSVNAPDSENNVGSTLITAGVAEEERLGVGDIFRTGAAFLTRLQCRLPGYVAARLGD